MPAPLPLALSGEAVAKRGHGFVVIGGLDAAGSSMTQITSVSASAPGAKARADGSLASPLHDAAAATIGTSTLVFGGGATATTDAVERLVPGRPAREVGQLPTPRSDLSAISIERRAYILGGYDGVTALAPVLETTDGRRFRAVASLPRPVRYSAVASIGPTIYAAGGELADGSASAAIQAIDTRTGSSRVVGRLTEPTSHASAVALHGIVYVLGGTVRAGHVTGRIVSFDPRTGRDGVAGRLPEPVTNAAAVAVGETGYLAGGLGRTGVPTSTIVALRNHGGSIGGDRGSSPAGPARSTPSGLSR